MKRVAVITFVLVFAYQAIGFGQADTQKVKQKLPAVIENGDTIAIYTLDDTKVDAVIDEATATKQKEWDRLMNSVRVCMPYALFLSNEIKSIDYRMAHLDKRKDKKKFLRAEREQLVKSYSDKLKNLSSYQGALLAKLIYRQTGKTSFDLIKEYESGFTAGFWQTLSRLDGMNLKATYDTRTDAVIEAAIKTAGFL